MTHRPYLTASIEELEAAFDEASEYAVFKAIAEELQHRKTPLAGKLRWRVGAAMAKARKEEGHPPSPGLPLFKAMIAAAEPTPPPSPPPPPRSSPLGALLARFDLEAPDGRPLHRYRLGDKGYEDLLAALRVRASCHFQGGTADAALLALWASAWFRREYMGGVRNYADLGKVLGTTCTNAEWRDLLERGLNWWKRPLIARAGRRHRLLTVAVEGGFPVRVLASGEGWLSRYLNEVVGRLLGLTEEPSPDDAFAMADAARDELRETYRQDAFIALAADLALAIVKLRWIAEATAPGLTPSTVLDQVRPGWRDELPIAAESDAARTLIDGMLAAARIARGLSGGAGCVRVLRRHQHCWRAGLRLSLAGELKGEVLAGLASAGTRLGVHPHGALARAVGEELAFLDPPGEDGEDWRLRPLTRRTELDGVPLEARIEVLLQSPRGAARVMPWPGGAPEQSDVVTFEIDAEDDDGPKTLLLAANGSASLRAERVVVTAPSDWQVRWQDEGREGAPDRIGLTDDGRGLWLADDAVLIESTDGGLLYCVETGVDEELRDRIVLNGSSPQGFEGAGDVPLFAGRPAVQCYRGRTVVQPGSEELLWRQSRGETWRALARSSLPSGVVDIMWRDARTRFVRDRVRVAIIPSGARVSRERDGDGWRFTFQGFGDFEVSPEPVEGLRVKLRAGGSLALSFHSNPRRRVTFNLRSEASARAIRIELPFPLTDGLAHWDGRLVHPGSTLTAAELGELIAFSEGPITLCSELKHAEFVVPAHYTLGERELALRPLADRIATDLATGGIDAWVELSFLGSTNMPYRIQPFDSSLCCESGRATIPSVPGLGDATLQVAGRCIDAPHEEHVLAEPSLEDVLNRRPIELPDHMTGAWLVYLRTGRVVRSRPTIIPCSLSRLGQGSGLAAAATIAAPAERRSAIRACLEKICANEDGAQDDLAWLHRLIASLDGVPAATFDALTALPRSPGALALLLLAAPDESLQAAVWRLEAELPFLWAALPRNAWLSAIDALGGATVDALRASGLDEEATASIARDGLTHAVRRVATLDNALPHALSACGTVGFDRAVPTLLDATGGYIRRTWDRGELAMGLPRKDSLFRTGDLLNHLPAWFEVRYDLTHLEALDAPLAVAAAAKGAVVLSPAQIRRCKAAMVEDPIYFAEGFAAALAHGQQERPEIA